MRQTKALLAARIIGILDDEGLSTRKEQERTGVGYADFARIRNQKLNRFTIDRLVCCPSKTGNGNTRLTSSAPRVGVRSFIAALRDVNRIVAVDLARNSHEG